MNAITAPGIDVDRTAVLALHWLRDFVTDHGALGAQFASEAKRMGVVDTTKAVLEWARRRSVPVIHVRVCFRPDYSDLIANCPMYHLARQVGALIDGTPGNEIIDELAPAPGDVVISNNRVGAFTASTLDLELRARGINTLLAYRCSHQRRGREHSPLRHRHRLPSNRAL